MAAAKNGNGNGNGYVWLYVIGGLVQAFWILAWGSMTAEMGRLQREIDKHGKFAEETYTKKENTEQYRQRVSVEIKNLQADSNRMLEQTRRLRDDVVSKDTYNGRHDAVLDDIKRMSTRIDEQRRDFGGAYTLSDKIKELQDQLKALQLRTYNAKPDKTQD